MVTLPISFAACLFFFTAHWVYWEHITVCQDDLSSWNRYEIPMKSPEICIYWYIYIYIYIHTYIYIYIPIAHPYWKLVQFGTKSLKALKLDAVGLRNPMPSNPDIKLYLIMSHFIPTQWFSWDMIRYNDLGMKWDTLW